MDESVLEDRLIEVAPVFIKLCGLGYYQLATKLYADMFSKILNEFFNTVRINVDDDTKRIRRLTILRNINQLYTRHIADLTKIVNRNI